MFVTLKGLASRLVIGEDVPMKTFSLEQSMKALAALRNEAGLPDERFPIQAFVGMISDEIEKLRAKGKTDEQISELVRSSSGAEVSSEEIAEHYATPEQRKRG